MRVLVVGLNYAPEPTGIAPYAAGLSAALARRGHEVRVLTTRPHYPEWQVPEDYRNGHRREVLDGVRVRRLRHRVPSRPTGLRRLLAELDFGVRAFLARWHRPDVVVFVSPALFSTGVAMLRARITRTPSVVWVQDLYSLGVVETRGKDATGRVAELVAALESGVLRMADGVVVIHDRFAEAVRRLHVAPDRVDVVRNWTHLRPRRITPREETRRALGWADDEVIALHSGAMGRKQNLDNLIAAARSAETDGAPVRFVLMGDGGERPRLEALARGLRAVEFLDPLPGDRFQDALAAADVLLVNEHAGMRDMAVPSKLTSYFSSGRPVVVASDAESITSAELDAAGAGVRVDPDRPAALVDAVLGLGRDQERAAAFGRAGRRYQKRVLSEGAALDRYSAVLERLVARTSRAPGVLERTEQRRAGRVAAPVETGPATGPVTTRDR